MEVCPESEKKYIIETKSPLWTQGAYSIIYCVHKASAKYLGLTKKPPTFINSQTNIVLIVACQQKLEKYTKTIPYSSRINSWQN